MFNKIKILFILTSLLLGACTSNIDNELKLFLQMRIHVPYEKLERRICSLYPDTVRSYQVYIIKYIDSYSCGTCMASTIANKETKYFDKYENVCFMYIIKTTTKEKEQVYRDLCSKRVRGSVFLDTENALLKSNPNFPDNSLFHTFVINNNGEVLMVGDPFLNDRMEALFNKVIENEKKKQKRI